MALETGSWISDLVVTNPTASDPISQGDDHLRLVKSTIRTTFPNVTGAMVRTHTELNSVTDRGLIAGQTWTGTHTFPATTYGVTAAFGATGVQFATIDFVNAVATSAALPGQVLGLLTSNGTTATFGKNLAFGLNEGKAAAVASSATPDIWSGNGNTEHITGTTTITGFTAAPQAGARRKLFFDGAVLLTNSANLNVQGAANYLTAPGDVVEVYADTTTVFYLSVTKARGAGGFTNLLVLPTTQTWTPPAGVTLAEITVIDGGDSGATNPAAVSTGGKGGDASVTIISVSSLVTYTATSGAGGVGPTAGTTTVSQAGSASSFSGTGITTLTSTNGTLKVPGSASAAGFVSGGVAAGNGGASLVAGAAGFNTTPVGIGAGGPGVNNGLVGKSGVAGGVIIRF